MLIAYSLGLSYIMATSTDILKMSILYTHLLLYHRAKSDLSIRRTNISDQNRYFSTVAFMSILYRDKSDRSRSQGSSHKIKLDIFEHHIRAKLHKFF